MTSFENLKEKLEAFANDNIMALVKDVENDISELEDQVEGMPDLKVVDLGLDRIKYCLEKRNLKVSNQLESAFELIKS